MVVSGVMPANPSGEREVEDITTAVKSAVI